MKRQYYRRGQVVEVEQLDGVVAVNSAVDGAERRRGTSPFGRSAMATVRSAVPEVDDEALDAFAAAGWDFVSPNQSTRDALARGAAPEASEAVGAVVVGRGGRVGIATDLLSVQLVASLSPEEAERVLSDAGLRVVGALNFAPNLYEVRTERGDALDASVTLSADDRFVFAEPSLIEHIPQRFTPSDPRYGDQWQWRNTGANGGTAGADVNVEPAWDHTFGAGVRVAVVDNGFDADHEDLAAGVGAGSGFFTAGAGGAAAAFTQGTTGMPDSNHGTFCAGMVGARRGNGDGGVGAAPDCELMLVACLGDQVQTQITLARAIAYAANPSTETAAGAATGADVIVSSLGPNGADWDLTSTLALAIEGAAANGRQGRGCAIFWAASNGNNVSVSLDEVVSHPDVIAVVRSTRNDLEDNAARGPEVDLIAPGVAVVSTESGDGYGDSTGTSFAAPCAAGCAALALSVDPALTRDGLLQVMRDTADKIGGVVYDATGHNDDYGFGRVNAFNAVRTAARRIRLTTPSVVFNDVPDGETTARAVVWEIAGIDDLTFDVVSGPSGPFDLLLGPAVTASAPGVGVTSHARIWLVHTGTTAGDTAAGTITVRSVETGETWAVAISANTVSRPTAAVVMVLDRSGSMAADAGDGRSRVEVLRESAGILVDLLQPDTGIGVVRFDHDAASVLAVVDAGPEVFGPGRAQAAAAVAGHLTNPAGATSIGDGVAAGAVLLDVAAPHYDKTAMIVLTDGQENAPLLISDVAGDIDDTVYAIGLGEPSAINPTALTALTNGTGGYVTMTGTLSSDEHFLLAKYYLQILAGVRNEQIVLDPDGFLKGGDSVAVPFELTRTDSAADVILLCPAPAVLGFTVVSPAGHTLNPAAAGITFVSGQSVAYYRFPLPVVDPAGSEHWGGTWTAELTCDPVAFRRYLQQLEKTDPKQVPVVAAHGLRYSLEVHSRSSLTFAASITQRDIAPGSPLHLVAQLSEFGLPIEDDRARVRAELTGPTGPAVIELTGAGSGVFQAEFVAHKFGVYRFRVVAEGRTLRGERFTREQLVSGSIYVPRPPEGDPKPPSRSRSVAEQATHRNGVAPAAVALAEALRSAAASIEGGT